MGIFASETARRGGSSGDDQTSYNFGGAAALLDTYVPAAEQVNIKCGPQFVNASLAQAEESAASMLHGSGMMGTLALGMVVMSWLL